MANQLVVEVMTKNLKALNDLERQLGSVQKSTLGLGSAAKIAAGAFAALGAGKVLKSFIDVGKSMENLQMRFKFLFGSAQEGAAAFETLTAYASTVPFSLDQIAAASGNLAVVSDDAKALGVNLQLAGNIAAVSGLDFQTAGEQLQRALSGGIGAADLLRDKGVTSLLGFSAGAKVSVAETQAAFQRVFGPGGEFEFAAAQLAQTFSGTMSMLGDKVFGFQKIVGKEFVGALNKSFGSLDALLKQNQQTLDDYASALGIGLAAAVESVTDGIKWMKDNSELLLGALQAIIALKVAAMFIRWARALVAVVASTRALVALTGVGIPLVIASVAAAGATYLAMGAAIDSVVDKMDTLKQAGADANMKAALGATEDNKDAEDSKRAEKKKAKADAVIKATIEKEKAFLDAMGQLGEDALQKNLRIEQERILKLEELRKIDIENHQLYTDLINQVETDAAAERIKIYEAEQAKKDQLHKKNLEAIKSGKYKEVDLTTATEAEMADIAVTQAKSTLDILASQNKKFFQLQKAVKIADAIQNTYVGATKAFAQGGIMGFVTGALVIAAGMAQVNAIRSQQYPGREKGGGVMSGRSYLVGEAGPEIFNPGSNGNITPNDQISGTSDGVNINFNISTVDARGFDELLTTRQDLIISLINRGLTERGRARII